MTFDEFIQPVIEKAAQQAAESAVRLYIEKTDKKTSRYGERMTVADLMRETGRARQTVYQMHSAGQIPGAVKIGGKLMFKTAEILPWIEVGCPRIAKR